MIAFVPLPPPPPEPVPVVKTPPGIPPNGSPLGLDPSTDQKIILFDGNAGEGVHVKTVSPPLHASVVDSVEKVVESMKMAMVALVSIASLKTKTTAADGETPLAGGGEMMVGAACAGAKCTIAQTRTSKPRKSPRRVDARSFIKSVLIDSKRFEFVTQKLCSNCTQPGSNRPHRSSSTAD